MKFLYLEKVKFIYPEALTEKKNSNLLASKTIRFFLRLEKYAWKEIAYGFVIFILCSCRSQILRKVFFFCFIKDYFYPFWEEDQDARNKFSM
jgi:hypothetical protein